MVWATLVWAGCGWGTPPQAEPTVADPARTELHVERAAGREVSAHWWGATPEVPEGTVVPWSYGVEDLCFRVPGASDCVPFAPAGQLFFSDWHGDVFSPDGAWTVLLQDRFGPYHVVVTDQLAPYLRGERAADRVVAADRPSPESDALVHRGLRWTGPSTFVYDVGKQEPSLRTVELGAAAAP